MRPDYLMAIFLAFGGLCVAAMLMSAPVLFPKAPRQFHLTCFWGGLCGGALFFVGAIVVALGDRPVVTPAPVVQTLQAAVKAPTALHIQPLRRHLVTKHPVKQGSLDACHIRAIVGDTTTSACALEFSGEGTSPQTPRATRPCATGANCSQDQSGGVSIGTINR